MEEYVGKTVCFNWKASPGNNQEERNAGSSLKKLDIAAVESLKRWEFLVKRAESGLVHHLVNVPLSLENSTEPMKKGVNFRSPLLLIELN